MIETEINKVNSAEQTKKPKAGEIYKCAFYEEIIGTEIKWPRPVLIISENWYNEEGNRIIVLPLTRYFNKQGRPKPFYVWEIRVKVGNQEGKIMVDQVHSLDKERLGEKVADLSSELLEKVMVNLKKLMVFKDKVKAKL